MSDAPSHHEPLPSSPDPLAPFFAPRGVAIIGASTDPNKLGFALARNLVQSGYRGAIAFVNPRGGRLLGRPVYPSIDAVPEPIDLAVILVAAPLVPEVLDDCGARGIPAAIVASGGFREIGPEGAALEAACQTIARRHGMRFIGPNCIGILDTYAPLDVTFLPPPGPTPGDVALISHSGAICAAVVDWARGQGFGLSILVSVGNQADITETDLLAQVAGHPNTHVLTMYMEGLRDGRRFVAEATKLAPDLPFVVLKVGRGESGRRATASHTGALAGDEAVYDAAFRRAGIIRADTSEEMFDWARALAWCPPLRGREVAVLTNAGGPGITATDALEANGLKLARLTDATQAALAAQLPVAASVTNPVDMLASASPRQYADSLAALLADPNVSGVLVVLPPPPIDTTAGVARAMIPIIYAADKPVVVALMGERMIQEATEHFRAARIPDYRFPERAAAALAALARRQAIVSRLNGRHAVAVTAAEVDRAGVAALLAAAAVSDGEFLPPELVTEILARYGIPVPAAAAAASAAAAVALAERFGYPVALKIVSADIVHKSDVGGVRLNLRTAADVRAGFAAVMENARAAQPAAEIDGVLVQQMVPFGQEVIIGAVQDPQFGPVVMFGTGGVEVEVRQDVLFALAPPTAHDLEVLLNQTGAGRRLRGWRTVPPADRRAVEAAIVRLAQLAADFPQLAEIEINPLVVLADGDGAFAADARMRLAEAADA